MSVRRFTALAQDAFKIGISGAATGPASPSYLPHIEGIRTYVRQLNDKDGVAGKKVDLVILDDKAFPTEAASNAKRLMDDEQALAVGLMSLSSTYAPMFQAATRTKTPVLLLGQAVCPATAAGPQINPLVFCAGSTSDPNTAAYWQVPLVKAIADQNKDTLKLALVAADIPISRRRALIRWSRLQARSAFLSSTSKPSRPARAADVSGAAARIIASGANYVTSWSPVTSIAVQMLGALRRQGWTGWYIHNHSAEAEETLRQLKDPKLVMSPEYAFSVEKLPVFDEMQTAAKKYGVTVPWIRWRWAGRAEWCSRLRSRNAARAAPQSRWPTRCSRSTCRPIRSTLIPSAGPRTATSARPASRPMPGIPPASRFGASRNGRA